MFDCVGKFVVRKKMHVKIHGKPWLPVYDMDIPELEDKSYPGWNVQEHIKRVGYWAAAESYIMCKVLEENKGVVLDIGANTGYFTLLGLAMGCSVISVEASPVHYYYLKQSLELNGWDCKYVNAFVSDLKENVDFDGWSGKKGVMHDGNVVKCGTVAMKDLCPNGALFTKIDVEGAEPDVLRSARPLLKEGKFDYIMFEITYVVHGEIDKEQIQMLRDLVEDGFVLYDILERDLRLIGNIDSYVDFYWWKEYKNCHLKACPGLQFAGTNILAVHKSCVSVVFGQKTFYGYRLDV